MTFKTTPTVAKMSSAATSKTQDLLSKNIKKKVTQLRENSFPSRTVFAAATLLLL
jgi:hypothetical protein